MSGTKRWRDSDHLERAVETAGGPEAFETGVARMLDEARGWQRPRAVRRETPLAVGDRGRVRDSVDA